MKRLSALFLLTLASTTPALAHPHVYVSVSSEVLFAPDGKVSAIRHHWKFDDMYSAFVTANLGEPGKGPTPADLLPVAKTNVESLKEFEFFTYPKLNARPATLKDAVDYSMDYDAKDQTVTLHFTLPLEAPATAGKAFVFQVYDPSYFVAFAFEKDKPVKLVAAPNGCSLSISKAGELSAADQKKLADSAGTNNSPGADFGTKLADSAIIACP